MDRIEALRWTLERISARPYTNPEAAALADEALAADERAARVQDEAQMAERAYGWQPGGFIKELGA